MSTAFIEKAGPWENGRNESFNGKRRNDLPKGEIFHALEEAKALIECRRRHDSGIGPRSALGQRPPTPADRDCSGARGRPSRSENLGSFPELIGRADWI